MEITSSDNTWTKNRKKDIPDGIWTKCPECNEITYNGELDRNLRICRKCSYHFAMSPASRLELLVDEGSFRRYKAVGCPHKDDNIVMSGKASISGYGVSLVVMNVGLPNQEQKMVLSNEFITAASQSIKYSLPLVSVYTSLSELPPNVNSAFSGYALSISTFLAKLDKLCLPYISVISQTCSNASYPGFVFAADVIIAEANILGGSHTGSRIGRREAEKEIKNIFDSGMADMIVPRRELRNKLSTVLKFFH